MKIEKINDIIGDSIKKGLIFKSNNTVLASAEGFNFSAVAVLGALFINSGKENFNSYCSNQKRFIGFFKSRTNPFLQKVYQLHKKLREKEPSVISMIDDVKSEFITPLVEKHLRDDGSPVYENDLNALNIVLLAKIIWDFEYGNEILAESVKMLKHL